LRRHAVVEGCGRSGWTRTGPAYRAGQRPRLEWAGAPAGDRRASPPSSSRRIAMSRKASLSGFHEWLPAERLVEQHVLDTLR
ncbi:hypothetical protein GUG60_04625, partial [Xanthomonas citri pv. citri]|nr:hypothetical protein [Xanthomonas citri pv. citri]